MMIAGAPSSKATCRGSKFVSDRRPTIWLGDAILTKKMNGRGSLASSPYVTVCIQYS